MVYYNADLRKTVRHLPGIQPSVAHSAKTQRKPLSRESVPPVSAPEFHAENAVFVPIDFATAMTIEGHESQVVHVGCAAQSLLAGDLILIGVDS